MADFTLSAKITADNSGFSKAFKGSMKDLDQFTSKTMAVGKEITGFGKNMTLTGAGMTAGFTMPFMKAIQTTGDFEAAMTKAGVIAGATSGELGQMTDAALELGATTSLSSNEVAEAMTEMAAKGFDATQVIAAMPGVISAAEASGEDLALTADVVASALNGFGLEAGDSGKVADILAMAANKTAAGVGDMGEAFKYSAPLASSLGISMEELSAATGLMVDAGLGGGQAGTTLRQALISLTKPTAKSADLMAELGFSAIDAQGNFKSMEQIVGELNGSMAGMTEAQKLSALATIFGTEAASGMNILLSAGQEELAGLTKELENSGGASAEAAALMKDNLNGVLDNLGGAIESATISVMSKLTPLISDVASFITSIIEKFNNLGDGAQTMIAFGALIVAAMGPVLTILGVVTMGIGGLVSAIGTIGVAFTAAGGAAGIFASALAFITGPVGLVIAGIAALVAVFVLGWQTSETFRNAVINSVSQIWGALQGLFSSVSGLIAPIIPVVSTIISGIVNLVITMVSQVISVVGPILSFVIDIMAGIIRAIQPIAVVVGQVLTSAWSIFSDVFSTILSYTGRIFNGVTKVISALSPVVKGVFGTIGDIVGTVMSVVGGNISSTFENIQAAWEGLKGFVGGIFDGISGSVQTLVGQVKGFVNGVIGGINSAVSLINKIPGVSIGAIPYLARGTDDFQGGFARINEGGRGELVNMPGGTQVIPHDVSMRYAREAGKQSSVSNAIDSKSKVMIPNENSKQSMNLTLNMGSKSFRGFVDDISNTQNAQIQLTESYL